MKFAIRLTLLAVFALALSFSLVSAQEDAEVSGAFVQASTTFTIEDAGDDTYTLTLSGVAGTTPLLLDGGITGGYLTGEFLADWLATETPVSLELRFQYGDPANSLFDYTIVANALPAGEYVDGAVTYTLTDVEVSFVELVGSAPDASNVLEGEKPEDAFADLVESGDYADSLYYVVAYVAADLTFLDALAVARVDRLNDARPSSIGGSCIPNVTCLPK